MELEADERRRVEEPLGDEQVLGRGRRIAARVIVQEPEARGLRAQERSERVRRRDVARVHAPARDPRPDDRAPASVDADDPHLLYGRVHELRHGARDVPGALERVARGRHDGVRGQHEGGGDALGLAERDEAARDQRRDLEAWQLARAVSTEQGAGAGGCVRRVEERHEGGQRVVHPGAPAGRGRADNRTWRASGEDRATPGPAGDHTVS